MAGGPPRVYMCSSSSKSSSKKVAPCARDLLRSLLPPTPYTCMPGWNPGHMYIYTRGGSPATYTFICTYIHIYKHICKPGWCPGHTHTHVYIYICIYIYIIIYVCACMPKQVAPCTRDLFQSLIPPTLQCKWNPGHTYIYTRGGPPATCTYICIYIYICIYNMHIHACKGAATCI